MKAVQYGIGLMRRGLNQPNNAVLNMTGVPLSPPKMSPSEEIATP